MRQVTGHDVAVFDCGLVINPVFLFLGASIDGKVVNCSVEHSEGLLEIRCPFKY